MSKHLLESPRQHISNCYPPVTATPGSVWYDSGTQSLKTYNGTSWVELEPVRQIMTWEAEKAIDKLIAGLSTQEGISQLADKYPLVQDALLQLQVALKLCENLNDD